jgi:hypothetical protein
MRAAATATAAACLVEASDWHSLLGNTVSLPLPLPWDLALCGRREPMRPLVHVAIVRHIGGHTGSTAAAATNNSDTPRSLSRLGSWPAAPTADAAGAASTISRSVIARRQQRSPVHVHTVHTGEPTHAANVAYGIHTTDTGHATAPRTAATHAAACTTAVSVSVAAVIAVAGDGSLRLHGDERLSGGQVVWVQALCIGAGQ